MGLTGFQRARRLAAQRISKPIDEVSYEEAIAILDESPVATADDLGDRSISRSDRVTQLKALQWDDLKALLESYGLPINKPKSVSWDAFAIPQILRHEGF